jgi:hypothetical protein
VEEDSAAGVERSHEGDDLHRLDLRSSAVPRLASKGSASGDVAPIALAKKKNDRTFRRATEPLAAIDPTKSFNEGAKFGLVD